MGNSPSAVEQTVSEPYAPLNPAPPGWSLQDAFAARSDEDGRYYVGDAGHVRFAEKKSYDSYVQQQQSLGGTPEQLAALHALITTGDIPFAGPVNPAPRGTTADALLNVRRKVPNESGFYELGTLRVHHTEYAAFRELQSTLCNRNPEARDMLYHMQHAREPLTFRITNQEPSFYLPDPATINWNPRAASRDGETGARVSPATAALHEEAHWAAGEVGHALAAIPSGMFGTFEERRAIEGIEARDMALLRRRPRRSHFADPFPVNKIDSISASLTVVNGNGRNSIGGPWHLSGYVHELTESDVTLSKHEDAAHPFRRDTILNIEEMGFAMGGTENAREVLRIARLNRDKITVALTDDGRLSYTNEAHEERHQRNGGPPLCPVPIWKQFEQINEQIHRDSPQLGRRSASRGR